MPYDSACLGAGLPNASDGWREEEKVLCASASVSDALGGPQSTGRLPTLQGMLPLLNQRGEGETFVPELYTAYLGMRARQRTLEIIANNVANASTTGFKGDRVLYSAVEAEEQEKVRSESERTVEPTDVGGQSGAGELPRNSSPAAAKQVLGVMAAGITNFTAGTIRQTGRSLDVALSGDGFFVVATPRGERYTRAGSFTLDGSGQLVTQSGDIVVGQSGPITVPPGEVAIGEDGTFSVGGQAVGRIKVARFADPRAALIKEGGSLFAPVENIRPVDDTGTRVVSGSLETSNINTLEEVAAMIQNNREFDSLHRIMTLKLRGEDDIGRI